MLEINNEQATQALLFKGGITNNCKLESVEFNPAYVTRDDLKLPEEQQVKKAAIIFHFSTNRANPTDHRILNWATYEPKEHNQKFFEIFRDRFKHIYEVYTKKGFPPMKNIAGYPELFKIVADTFNGNVYGEDGKLVSSAPIYRDAQDTPIAINIKAVYDKFGKIGFGFGNIIELYDAKNPTKTNLEKKMSDNFEVPEKPKGLLLDEMETPKEELPF